MTQLLGKITADFETSLAVKMAVGATTGTLQSATDSDGVALPTGRYFLTIDRNNTTKEYISCTLTGTALTAIKTISRQGVETSGTIREHRVGANVIISDFAHIKKINDLLDGTTSFDSGTPLGYDGAPSITTGNQLATKTYVDSNTVALTGTQTVAGVKTFSSSPIVPTPTTDFQASTKKYVDDTAVAGAPNASTTVKGIVEEATQAEIEAQTAAGATGARLFTNPSTAFLAFRNMFTVEVNTTGTYSLTTTAGQRVIVYAKGSTGTFSTGVDTTYTLNYNGVQKDIVTLRAAGASQKTSFALMYTEIPGAATANITLSGGNEIVMIIIKY